MRESSGHDQESAAAASAAAFRSLLLAVEEKAADQGGQQARAEVSAKPAQVIGNSVLVGASPDYPWQSSEGGEKHRYTGGQPSSLLPTPHGYARLNL